MGVGFPSEAAGGDAGDRAPGGVEVEGEAKGRRRRCSRGRWQSRRARDDGPPPRNRRAAAVPVRPGRSRRRRTAEGRGATLPSTLNSRCARLGGCSAEAEAQQARQLLKSPVSATPSRSATQVPDHVILQTFRQPARPSIMISTEADVLARDAETSARGRVRSAPQRRAASPRSSCSCTRSRHPATAAFRPQDILGRRCTPRS